MADVFRALSDPTRRAILDELSARDGQTLFELCGRLATNHDLTSSRQAVSQHLEVLQDVGLVRARRDGRYKIHHLDTAPLEPLVGRWLDRPAATRPTAAEDTGTSEEKGSGLRIALMSVLVDDQQKAVRFYTEVLGFRVKHDVPVGEARWITLVSPADPDGTELVLETSDLPAAEAYRDALVADGIPFTSFAVDDVDAEHRRLRALGVHFTQPPTVMGDTTTAVLDDTCGNLVQIHQWAPPAEPGPAPSPTP
ncbi:metalloregulator ArsR/SmtB family transcription factor [Auraticoccus cholistanensis]|uniref:metalloregulator ArsR/SmtB family transcription factor n=1 Tax=Auraticoccus cholistanensis TaxID=2656650 RepID=UPI002F919D32